MKQLVLAFLVLALAALLASGTPVSAQAPRTIQIAHAPPTGASPGHQIYVEAVFVNATSGTIAWRNATMTTDEVVPMTNLSTANGSGWTFAAYLPAQSSPTQISYTLNASNAEGFRTESYFLSVDVPATGGLTPADQEAWVYTMAASITMVVTTIAVLYWYTGRRLRREVN